jgi:hypothetical protein
MKISQTLRVKDALRKSRHDVHIFISLLLIVTAILMPSFLMRKPVPWKAAEPTSFVESMKTSFAGIPGKPYTPTINASLTIDYFVLGHRNPVFYRYHSLIGHLCRITLLWLLLRTLRVPANICLLVALLSAIWPSRIESVMHPQMRGIIAESLFIYAALLCATRIDSQRWLWWMVGCSLCCIIAVGASMIWSTSLILGIPLAALWCSKRKTGFPWERLILPMAVLLLTIAFSFHQSQYISYAAENGITVMEAVFQQ